MIIDQIVHQLAQSIAANEEASLVVCGGSSPLGIFDALAAGEHEDEVEWSRVTITLVDDRLVPADHEHSNQKLLHDHLLRGAVTAAKFVPLEANHSTTNNEIVNTDLMTVKRPFDVMLLGMGVDGHFASLFPDMVDEASMQPDTPPMIVKTEPKGSPKLPRVSMNLAMILHSKLLILLVTGAEKQAVLKAAQNDRQLPVHALLKQNVTPLKIVTN